MPACLTRYASTMSHLIAGNRFNRGVGRGSRAEALGGGPR
jgi:hypothetical protein